MRKLNSNSPLLHYSTTSSPCGITVSESLDQGASQEVMRANLYQVLARVFSSPLEMDEGDPEALRLMISDLDPVLQKAGLTLAQAWEDALEDSEALSLSYAKLFLGPFRILASPYASFYLEPDRRLMGEVSQEVSRAYATAGLGPGKGPLEAPDHVALEWEFMYYLTYKSIMTGEECWIEQREKFRTTHMNRWLPSLAEAIIQSGEHTFYGAVSKFLTALNDRDCKQ